MEELKYNMTVDHMHKGLLQTEIRLESTVHFIVVSLALSLLSMTDLAVIRSKNVTQLDFLDLSHHSDVLCIERPQLLNNTKNFFCPYSAPSKSTVLQILSSGQISTDIVSTHVHR